MKKNIYFEESEGMWVIIDFLKCKSKSHLKISVPYCDVSVKSGRFGENVRRLGREAGAMKHEAESRKQEAGGRGQEAVGRRKKT